MARYGKVKLHAGPPQPLSRPGGMADEGAVDVDEPTDQAPERQTAHRDEPEPCPCGSRDHAGTRIGEQLSPSGGAIGPVYVCPAESPAGLRGAL